MIALDLEIFTKKINSALRRHRTIYDLLEFLSIALIVLLISIFFNLDAVFKLIPLTEPYVGLSPNLPFLTINYERIFLFFVVCLASLILMELYERSRKQIRKSLKKELKKKQDAKDVVEETYPELKDRLKTAYDTRKEDNFIARRLNQSVSKDVENVASTDLLDKKRVLSSLGVIFVCGLFLSALFVTGYTAPFSPDDILSRFPSGSLVQSPVTEDENSTSNTSSSIPTDTPPISSEPGVDIDITLPPGTGMGPGDMLESTEDSSFTPSTPYPPESLSSQHFYDDLPAGYEDIIKDYFKKLAENG